MRPVRPNQEPIMASSRIPGPQCRTHHSVPIDPGTLVRMRSREPGSVGISHQRERDDFHRMRPHSRRRGATGIPSQPAMTPVEITVALITLPPITLNIEEQLAFANRIFACCRVSFRVVSRTVADLQTVDSLIGNNHRIEFSWDRSAMMMRVADRFSGVQGRIKVFCVRHTGTPRAYAIGYAQDQRAIDHHGERVYISDRALPDTLAHELGHILLNHHQGEHDGDPNNLMADGDTRDRLGQNLNDVQRPIIRSNADLMSRGQPVP